MEYQTFGSWQYATWIMKEDVVWPSCLTNTNELLIVVNNFLCTFKLRLHGMLKVITIITKAYITLHFIHLVRCYPDSRTRKFMSTQPLHKFSERRLEGIYCYDTHTHTHTHTHHKFLRLEKFVSDETECTRKCTLQYLPHCELRINGENVQSLHD